MRPPLSSFSFWRALDTSVAHFWRLSPLGKGMFFPACGRSPGSVAHKHLIIDGGTGKRRCKTCTQREKDPYCPFHDVPPIRVASAGQKSGWFLCGVCFDKLSPARVTKDTQFISHT